MGGSRHDSPCPVGSGVGVGGASSHWLCSPHLWGGVHQTWKTHLSSMGGGELGMSTYPSSPVRPQSGQGSGRTRLHSRPFSSSSFPTSCLLGSPSGCVYQPRTPALCPVVRYAGWLSSIGGGWERGWTRRDRGEKHKDRGRTRVP